ncbi:hypothetical protein [Chitinophaga sp. sic0106]|uniref:hypothetical protein n=1 Tax=Chitinophaga sp. sic0106 TaxID=2854785 RepID=UPI001C486B9E|nr:hypothetical protein [Chitinophaga sp. sic0106]MBV7533887.1 hypothetical protein [Chitinophaga sp. sic0106]
MEKIYALIDKLQELRYTGADLQTISYYTQMLQAEVLHARNRQHQQNQQIQAQSNQGQIAVIMPARQETFVTVPEPAVQTTTLPANKPEVTQTDIPEKEIPVVSWEPPVTEEKVETAAPVHQREQTPEQIPPAPVQYQQEIPAPYNPPAPAYHPEPSPVQHAPIPPAAMPQQAPAPEPLFHQPAAEKSKPAIATLFDNIEPKTNNGHTAPASLNERLAQQKVELGQKLGQQRVQDLKSAIGINDKYQFISELFNNDTDLYERSIKTINDFPSLQDADRWIQREIKILQGWQDDHPLVQQFYTLLRKRFS